MKPQGSTRPPKWPFLLGDAAFLTVAIVIGFFEPSPLSDVALVLIFSCVCLGAALAVVPFFLDFSAARHEDLVEAREELEILAQKLADSADIIGTVSGHLRSTHEATLKAVHLAESLPYRMQEKMGELTQLLQQGQDDEKETMARELEELREAEGRRLETVAEKIRAATKEMSSLEKETRAGLDAAVKRVQEAERSLTAATNSLERRMIAAGAEPAESAPEPKPAKPVAAPAKSEPEPPSEPAPEANDEPAKKEPATKPRAAAKSPKSDKPAATPEVEETSEAKAPAPKAAPAARKKAPKPPEDDSLPGLDPIVVRVDEDESDGQAAKTSDGNTRLLVTAYIGIGNKVFIRGEGPGLNPDKGKLMEFVSIGKWLWQTPDATSPVTVQVYKNDEIKSLGDDITIDPGHHVEVTPVFRDPNPF